MKLEYLLILAAGLLLFLLLWPRGGDVVSPLPEPGQPRGEIEIEGESVMKWSADLLLHRELPPLAQGVRPRILLAWAVSTAAVYPEDSRELAAAAEEVRPRIMIAWAALSTSIFPQADRGLIGEASEVGPRILLGAAATTAAPPLGHRPPLDAEASTVSPRIVLEGVALSTLDLALQTAPAELEAIPSSPRVLLNASDMGSPVDMEGPPGLPEERGTE